MKRRHMMLGVGMAALGALGVAAQLQASDTAPKLEDDHVIVVDQAGAAAVTDVVEGEVIDPHLISQSHQLWGLRLAVGSLIAGLAGLIGFNRLLNGLVRGGEVAAKAIAVTAKAPVKAAKIVAKSAAKGLEKPGKFLLGTGVVAAVLIGSIAILDIQWKAGLVVGAGAAIAGMVGWNKLWKDKKPKKETSSDAQAYA